MLLSFALHGCDATTATAPPATWTDTDDGSTSGLAVTALSLDLVNGISASGSAVLWEVHTEAGTDCVSGIELFSQGSPAGIWLGEAAFVAPRPGVASRMIPPASLQFAPADAGADGGAMTHAWAGTLLVSAWSADEIRLDLVDGVLCDLAADPSCTDATGQLTLSGPRQGTLEGGSRPGSYEDVATSEVVCRSDL